MWRAAFRPNRQIEGRRTTTPRWRWSLEGHPPSCRKHRRTTGPDRAGDLNSANRTSRTLPGAVREMARQDLWGAVALSLWMLVILIACLLGTVASRCIDAVCVISQSRLSVKNRENEE